MKFMKSLKTKLALAAVSVSAVAALAAGFSVSAIPAGSIPYVGAETSGVNFPAFNIFNGVPSVGNEADFIRAKVDGEANSQLRNQVNKDCKTGDRFDIWFYVHNGAKPSLNNNGSGPGVAKDVMARVNLPQGEMTSFNVSGGVTASNAQAINDSAVINCGGKKFKLKYVDNSATAFLDLPNKNVSLPDAFVNGGTPIGTNLLNGQVWGCWDQRVWMGLKVVVEEVEEQPSIGECEALELLTLDRDNRRVRATINGRVDNAQIVGYRINFGDGTVVNQQSAEHTYATPGTKNVVGEVQIRFADGRTEWKTATGCAKQVTFDEPIVSFKCDSLSVAELSENNFRFTASGSVQNANITGYTFRLNGNVVQNGTSPVYNLSEDTPGDYTVSVVVNTDKGVTPQSEVCTKTVTVEQDQEQSAKCDLLSLTKIGGRKVRLAVTASVSGGATIERYIYNFGDGTQSLTSDNSVVEHEYASDGNYTATVQVEVRINGEQRFVTSANCSAPVTFAPGPCVNNPNTPEDECNPCVNNPSTPEDECKKPCVDNPNTSENECVPKKPQQPKPARLPDTGIGGIATIFATVTSLSSLAYYAVVRRFTGL